ncbi:putative Cornichon protein [Trypanosoma vivax]|uniref:Cornichon protein n=1 Tax=Trypanosoma vivax (strain Y486) TaxID=1055687 RepID=G0UCT1_TRYVY|nr:hypothetical protein TRVL_02333 [Trypanosoma vivax]KAH8608209.1 putative Cornichon protein [Trypanosoma vivax]CCC53641.1 conserved hypothetical protein [Trypanosoma vivax Y486]
MDNSQRFYDALAMQGSWVRVLVTQRHRPHTSRVRKQAMLFAFMHLCFLLVFAMHFFHTIVAWVLAFLLQTAAVFVSVLHLVFVLEYEDRTNNAMELEQQLNPLIIAELSIRLFSLVHLFMLRWWISLVFSLAEPLYDYWIFRRGAFLVDATSAWKQLRLLRLDARLRIVYHAILLVFSSIALVFSIVEERES